MRLMDEILEVECGPEKHDALMAMKVSWADEPCATKSFEEFHKWTSKYFLKPFMGIDNNQSFNLFLAGRAAMMLEGDWLVGQLQERQQACRLRGLPVPRQRAGSMASASTTTSAPRAKIRTSRRSSSTIWSRRRSSRPISAIFGGSVNKNVKSDSTEPLDLAWAKIFGDVKRRLRQRRPGVPAGRDDGIFADDQRGRQRPSRSEGGGRRTAEIHRRAQVASSHLRPTSIGGRPAFRPDRPELARA